MHGEFKNIPAARLCNTNSPNSPRLAYRTNYAFLQNNLLYERRLSTADMAADMRKTQAFIIIGMAGLQIGDISLLTRCCSEDSLHPCSIGSKNRIAIVCYKQTNKCDSRNELDTIYIIQLKLNI